MDAGSGKAVRTLGARRRLGACAALVLAGAALWTMHSRFSDSQSPGGTVRIMPHGGAATAMPPALAPVASLAMFELHGIGNPGALIAAHGERPRWYRRGEAIRGSIVLADIARGHVVLADGAARLRIDLPQRLGGSGEPVPAGLRGLRPEPQPPSGERSGAELTAGASAARAAVPEPATPEEQEAARLGQLPGAAS